MERSLFFPPACAEWPPLSRGNKDAEGGETAKWRWPDRHACGDESPTSRAELKRCRSGTEQPTGCSVLSPLSAQRGPAQRACGEARDEAAQRWNPAAPDQQLSRLPSRRPYP